MGRKYPLRFNFTCNKTNRKQAVLVFESNGKKNGNCEITQEIEIPVPVPLMLQP